MSSYLILVVLDGGRTLVLSVESEASHEDLRDHIAEALESSPGVKGVALGA